MRSSLFIVPLAVGLFCAGSAMTVQAQESEGQTQEPLEQVHETYEEMEQVYHGAAGVAQDVRDGDPASAADQETISTWRPFNQQYGVPGIRGFTDRIWAQDQAELDGQREERHQEERGQEATGQREEDTRSGSSCDGGHSRCASSGR